MIFLKKCFWWIIDIVWLFFILFSATKYLLKTHMWPSVHREEKLETTKSSQAVWRGKTGHRLLIGTRKGYPSFQTAETLHFHTTNNKITIFIPQQGSNNINNNSFWIRTGLQLSARQTCGCIIQIISFYLFKNSLRGSYISFGVHEHDACIKLLWPWEISGKRELPLNNYFYQISLWPFLWEIVLFDDWRGRSQSPGSNIPRQVGLGYVRKVTGKWEEGVRGGQGKRESDIILSSLKLVGQASEEDNKKPSSMVSSWVSVPASLSNELWPGSKT